MSNEHPEWELMGFLVGIYRKNSDNGEVRDLLRRHILTTTRLISPTIKAGLAHDAGAIGRCNKCGRYTLDARAMTDRPPQCDCGESNYWSGSFRAPGADAEWALCLED